MGARETNAMAERSTNDARNIEPRHQSAHQPQIDMLAAHFVEQADTGLPKHVRVRNAILEAIHDGSLKAGDQIPPEQDLSAAVNISLGTVQRALGHLANDGTLIREHGRGTFVAEPRRPVDELWQVRFIAEDGQSLLPVYSRIVDQRVIKTRGPWSEALGPDRKGYLQISRSLNVGDKFPCYSRFIVQMSRFAGLRRKGNDRGQSVNLRRILGDELGAPTTSVTQRVRIVRLADDICDALSIDHGTNGLMIDAIGHSYGGDAISFHRIWAPPSEYALDMTQDAPVNAASTNGRRTLD